VSLVYVDTSALGRLLLEADDKQLIEDALDSFDERMASSLLRIELHRLGQRHNLPEQVEQLLRGIMLIPLGRRITTTAETLTPPVVASLDAIHLATAVHLQRDGNLDALMTYDKQLAAGAREHGIAVVSPR
jgi:predicted nucleic acid-binding protein